MNTMSIKYAAKLNRSAHVSGDLIYCISKIQNEMKSLIADPSQEKVDRLSKLAASFDALVEAYKASAFETIQVLTQDDEIEEEEITAIQTENGTRLQ